MSPFSDAEDLPLPARQTIETEFGRPSKVVRSFLPSMIMSIKTWNGSAGFRQSPRLPRPTLCSSRPSETHRQRVKRSFK